MPSICHKLVQRNHIIGSSLRKKTACKPPHRVVSVIKRNRFTDRHRYILTRKCEKAVEPVRDKGGEPLSEEEGGKERWV